MFQPVFDLLQSSAPADRDFVLQDLPRWMRSHPRAGATTEAALHALFQSRQEFRSILAYRMKMLKKAGGGDLSAPFQKLMAKHSWSFVTNLYLSCDDIGPGLYVEHGFSTIVYARKIGANFRVNQNVTIGTGNGGHPTIGDDVSIFTGSIVIGGIAIGDRVRVGAGSVVLEDVPAGATVVPPKARILLATS